ncbi:flagellar hook-associated protein FlgL [Planctobacterium marinum]|uniref:flagellar hook-associated protein FlgL n=1 Tax=Planctobacterium marinum TaxID=1631968 RepID=UPI001E3E1371|nr:flagellar hook-associated protein FlgL [Planctobacterium marinum]MCC2606274.1 flagellar hook-associated protein FlgL [Planctobacterium marinum]
MRISNNQIFDRAINGVIDNQIGLSETQLQLSSGKKLITPSDDPVGAASVLRLTEELDQITQYNRNNTLLQNSLSQEEAVLSNVTSSANRARVLVVQAGNGINTDEDRTAIAGELAQIRDEIFDLMNSQDANGNYIFAGNQSDSPAFVYNATATGNRYVFQGDDGQNKLQLSNNVTVAGSDSGKDVFENVLARLTGTVTGGTANASVKVIQQGEFDNFHKANYDAVTAANNVFTGTVNGAGNQITFDDPDATTLNFTSGEPFTFKGVEFTVTGGAASTVEFTLSQPEKKNLAVTLDEIVAALNDPTVSGDALSEALNDALVGLDNGLKEVSNTVATIGGRVKVATSVYESNLDLEIANKDARSKIEDVDYAEAISELSKQETALQAAQQTFGRVTNLSLFDYI